jgi:Zn-dependent peptidase ImmA (M78 family)
MTAARADAIHAIGEAARVRRELEIDEDAPADPFQVIRDLGLWLVFGDMQKMLGGLVRQGAGGVMISTSRDVAVQRYTAAHELGHYYLHRDLAIWDDEAVISGRDRTPSESNAQLFAGAFLMPSRLVNLTLRRLGATPTSVIDPRTAYLASREMQVSYQAAVEQLSNLDLVSRAHRAALLLVRPIDIKTELLGVRPLNGRAQVHTPGVADLNRLTSRPGDEILLPLPSGSTVTVDVRSASVIEWIADSSQPILRSKEPGHWTAQALVGGTTVELQGETLRSPADVNSELLSAAAT